MVLRSRFLNAIKAEVPAGKLVHAILDNYAAHKHPKVLAWLARHPRFVFDFTPTSGSWLNVVETFFAAPTKRRLKRGVFRSVVDLQAAINRFIEQANHEPKPFVWTAGPDKILAAVNRGRQLLDSVHYVFHTDCPTLRAAAPSILKAAKAATALSSPARLCWRSRSIG